MRRGFGRGFWLPAVIASVILAVIAIALGGDDLYGTAGESDRRPTKSALAVVKTPTHQITATANPQQTAIAALPVTVYNASGTVVGTGEVRLFAPKNLKASQNGSITLELELTHRYITPTPLGSVNVAPTPFSSYTPNPDLASPTPQNLISAAPLLQVFERMGANLNCLSSSFEGCDENDGNFANSSSFVHIDKPITTWVWPIKARSDTVGDQILTVELWRLEIGNGMEARTVEWSHQFTIEVIGADSNRGYSVVGTTTSNTENIGSEEERFRIRVAVGIVVGIFVVGAAFFTIRQRRTVRQAKREIALGPNARSSVFISFRTDNEKEIATKIRDKLQNLNCDVFLDANNLQKGRHSELIDKALIDRRFFVLLLGSNTLEEATVVHQINLAIAHNKPIIPILDQSLKPGLTSGPDNVRKAVSQNKPLYMDRNNLNPTINQLATRIKLRPSIFISYQRSSGGYVADILHNRLTTLGGDVFIDKHSINEGRFATIIRDAITERDYFVVVLAPGTLESEWVRRETAMAMEQHKHIIPIFVDGFDMNETILPNPIEKLGEFNGIKIEQEYLDEAIAKLATFLNLNSQ